jgi:opacity protein-like surface antigen
MNKLAGLLGLAVALVGSSPALADRYVPVPAPAPVPETFSYYLRADIQWGFSGSPSFSEKGRDYTGTAFTSSSTNSDDIFSGSVGFGAYLGPRLRADFTLDFRDQQEIASTKTYTGARAGTASDIVQLRGTVGLANIYWDILPRGHFSPYIGAGAGFVYNDLSRTYLASETSPGPGNVSGSGRDTHVGFAGALMAGITFASDHRFVWDLSYRALYMDGGDVNNMIAGNGVTATPSQASIGSQWEQQVRIGIRANIW